jgi:hypothetical protein
MPDALPPSPPGDADRGAAERSDSQLVGGVGGPPAEPIGPAEPEGPLSLQRYRKRDGRQLILFARREREP